MSVIPDWTEDGLLPAGCHEASWDEIQVRFGWNRRRERLLGGLAVAIQHLVVVRCSRIWLDGSFVTAKELPGDYDIVWDMEGVTLEALDPVFLDLAPPRSAQHEKYGGDLLPNVIERGSGAPFLDFFKEDALTGVRKGIVELWLPGGVK